MTIKYEKLDVSCFSIGCAARVSEVDFDPDPDSDPDLDEAGSQQAETALDGKFVQPGGPCQAGSPGPG
jgi:hypothetical protein